MRYRDRDWPKLTGYLTLGTIRDTTYTKYVNNCAERIERCVDELHPGPPYRSGGVFDKFTMNTEQWTPKAHLGSLPGVSNVDLYHIPYPAWLSYETSAYMDHPDENWGDISSFGPTGWNRYRPTKPKCDLGVALAELRELPKMLLGTARSFRDLFGETPARPSVAGDAWLNAQFGWLPFIKDVRDFTNLTTSLNKRLKQLRRDNGKWVRRGGPVFNQNETTTLVDTDEWGVYPKPAYYYLDGRFNDHGRRLLLSTESQEVWFTARFRYHLPPVGTWRWKAKQIAMLYGCVPSPALLWELIPFSWLIDWCSNTGDCLEMISSILTEDLCAKYAYIMGTTRKQLDFYGKGCYKEGNTVEAHWEAYYERKFRVPASRFGFGLTESNFTARQWSILGALGLSRLS